MTLKSGAKFEKKLTFLTFCSKNDTGNLVNFNASSGKFNNLHFNMLLLSKVYYVRAKKRTEELCAITLKNDTKFEKELTCALMWVLGNFWRNTQRSQNLHFNGLPLTKVCNVWAKIQCRGSGRSSIGTRRECIFCRRVKYLKGEIRNIILLLNVYCRRKD